MQSRTPNIHFTSKEKDEGVGARVRRSIGLEQLKNFDPFLMLDEFRVQAPAGFPDHPHRGFETVTYVLNGEVNHQDFMGNKGTLKVGDLQWMTAGRGIVHCEMPGKDECIGLQLWVNLKKADKMVPPEYQELSHKEIPQGQQGGIKVKVIAGESLGVKSPVHTRTPAHYIDFKLAPGSVLDQPVPQDWNAFVYVLTGETMFGPDGKGVIGKAHQMMTFNQDGDSIRACNKSSSECHFVMVSGQPIGEPIVQYGPIVMTTEEDAKQALLDYRKGQNGFENAHTWNSDYAR